MSKGIIVVDIPDKCDGCEMCGTLIGKVICVAMIKRIHDINARPEWCPIKPVPERACHEEYWDNGRYDKGWNECLEAILKGGKDNGAERTLRKDT